jgi:hypothetical protein
MHTARHRDKNNQTKQRLDFSSNQYLSILSVQQRYGITVGGKITFTISSLLVNIWDVLPLHKEIRC